MGIYQADLELYRKSGDICAYLNITRTTKSDVDNLADKLSELDAQTNERPIVLIGTFLVQFAHQRTVAECAFYNYLEKIASQWYYDAAIAPLENGKALSPILPWVLFPAFFALASILLNASLVYVSMKRISLSKICNSLILFDALCQIPVVFPFLVNLLALITGLNPVHHRICLYTLMASTASTYASFMAIFLISLERLLIVLFPMRMHSIRAATIRKCTFTSFAICILFGTFMAFETFHVWTIVNLIFHRSLLCNSGLYSDVLNRPATYALLILSILNYLLIFLIILWRHFREMNSIYDQNRVISASAMACRRMLRSVFILSCWLLIGWIVASAARNQITGFIRSSLASITSSLMADKEAAEQLANKINTILVGLITCVFLIAAGIGAPVLILTNSEYRNAYKAAFLSKKKSASIGPLFMIKG